MAKPELGTKRLCGNCGAKFYDLSKDPIVCPKCHTVMEVADAEFVSLEEADAEAQGKKPGEAEAAEGTEEEEVEIEDEGMDDATFIEEQEEGDEDVTDIIGDRDDEEET